MKNELRQQEIKLRRDTPRTQIYHSDSSILELRAEMVDARCKQQHSKIEESLETKISEEKEGLENETKDPTVNQQRILKLNKNGHIYILSFEEGSEADVIDTVVYQSKGYYLCQDENGIKTYGCLSESERPNFDYFDAAVIAYKIIKSQMTKKVSSISKKIAQRASRALHYAINVENKISRKMQTPVYERLKLLGYHNLDEKRSQHLKRMDILMNSFTPVIKAYSDRVNLSQ